MAKRENRSVSNVVREAVAEYVTAQTQDSVRKRRLKALEKIREHRRSILRERGGKPTISPEQTGRTGRRDTVTICLTASSTS